MMITPKMEERRNLLKSLIITFQGQRLSADDKQQQLENAGFSSTSVLYLSPNWTELKDFLNLTPEQYEELGFIKF